VLRIRLEQLGHIVSEAGDGITGVAVARRERPDIAFVDVDLPGVDGYEVAHQLRSNQDTQDTYLVTLTGRGGERDRRRAQEAGFDEHVTKPMSADRLSKILTARGVKDAA